jgi:hypothetical protein
MKVGMNITPEKAMNYEGANNTNISIRGLINQSTEAKPLLRS